MPKQNSNLHEKKKISNLHANKYFKLTFKQILQNDIQH